MKSAQNTWYGAALIASCLWMALAVVSHALSIEDKRMKIAAAREALRISEASQKVIQEELARLKANEPPPFATIERYQGYLDRMSATVDQQREILHEMEAVHGAHDTLSQDQSAEPGYDPALVPSLPTSTNASYSLDREFRMSLDVFDGILMNEMDELARDMEEIEDAVSEESSELASAIEAAKKRLEEQSAGDKGEDAKASSTGDEKDPGEQGERSNAATKPGEEQQRGKEKISTATSPGGIDSSEFPGESGDGSEAGEQSAGDIASTDQGDAQSDRARGPTGHGDADAEKSDTREREKRGDGHDDDIVAGQLREAAEKATDPVLKAKLWEEYDNYKK